MSMQVFIHLVFLSLLFYCFILTWVIYRDKEKKLQVYMTLLGIIMVIKYMVEFWGERMQWNRQNGSCPIESGRSEEMKAVTNGLIWEVSLPLRVIVIAHSGWLPRAMSGYMSLLHPWSILMPMISVTTKDHDDALSLSALYSHFGAEGLCHCRGHPDLNSPRFHMGPWWHLDPSCTKGPCLDLWSFRSLCW